MKKIAMITGGCRGIGLAISRALAKQGYQLSIMGTAKVDKVQDIIDELRLSGPVLYTSGDLGNAGDRAAYVDATLAKFGRIDVLINNAGVAPEVRADLLDMSEESYERVMTINLKGPLFLSQLVAKAMVKRIKGDQTRPSADSNNQAISQARDQMSNQASSQARDQMSDREHDLGDGQGPGYPGVMINVGSISADVISLNRGEYCLSKTGAAMMTKLYAARLAEYGIPVFEVRPGIIQTDMTAGVQSKYNALIEQGQFPIARWGRPEDLADAVMLLISGKLRYSTGDCLHVDGGFHIRQL